MMAPTVPTGNTINNNLDNKSTIDKSLSNYIQSSNNKQAEYNKIAMEILKALERKEKISITVNMPPGQTSETYNIG